MPLDIGEWIAGLNAGDIGLAGLVTLAVLMLFTGMLVPGRWVNRMEADYTRQLARADEATETWKDAYRTSEEARRMQDEGFRELMELARTSNHLIQAMTRGS